MIISQLIEVFCLVSVTYMFLKCLFKTLTMKLFAGRLFVHRRAKCLKIGKTFIQLTVSKPKRETTDLNVKPVDTMQGKHSPSLYFFFRFEKEVRWSVLSCIVSTGFQVSVTRFTFRCRNSRLVSHTHTHTIDVIVDVRMTSCDVIVGIGMTSLPVYGHTECDTRLVMITLEGSYFADLFSVFCPITLGLGYWVKTSSYDQLSKWRELKN